eukprot:gb/GECG01011391.1/.p1 GENE.gb/GECG01011391.1/~~gb/GECG01011391.1/.p1  ORF type:complete len:779 (+),score=45.74 gb/GECG01011391.1/:1-2337(+)
MSKCKHGKINRLRVPVIGDWVSMCSHTHTSHVGLLAAGALTALCLELLCLWNATPSYTDVNLNRSNKNDNLTSGAGQHGPETLPVTKPSSPSSDTRPPLSGSIPVDAGQDRVCKSPWNLQMPFKNTVLKNHYTPFCIAQRGLHGGRNVELRSREGQILETITVPFYKSQGCGLLAGNTETQSEITMHFAGCDKNAKELELVEPQCNTRFGESSVPVKCLRDGQNPGKGLGGLIVLPKNSATISNADMKLGGGRKVLFTASSLHSNYRQLRRRGAPLSPLLTLRKSFFHGSNVWFAFGPAPRASSLIKFVESNVALSSSVFIGRGSSRAIVAAASSRFQITMSEFSSTGGIWHMKLHSSYAVVYRTHSISSCSGSETTTALSNYEFVGQFMQSLPPTIWMSTIVNWCQSGIVSIKSLNRIHLRESIVEMSELVVRDKKLVLFDVFAMTPATTQVLQKDTPKKRGKRLGDDNTTGVLHFSSHSRFQPHVHSLVPATEFAASHCRSTNTSHGAIGWMERQTCEVDKRSVARVLKFEECPIPENAKVARGSQHQAYITTVDGFTVVIRYPRRGKPPIPKLADTLIHPSMGFRIGTCTRPGGGTAEVYPAVSGSKPKNPKRDLSLDATFNIALDVIEAFAFLNYGNPFGSTGHGDFAVGYFQSSKIEPRIKNIVVDHKTNIARLFDFDGVRVVYQRWTFRSGMRQDLRGVGFVLWNLCGMHLTKTRVEPRANSQLVNRCSQTLRGLCTAANFCIDGGKHKTLTTEQLYMMVQEGIPQELFKSR